MSLYAVRTKILVVTEGYTEKNYFEKFRRRDSGYELIVRRCPENTPNKISRFCISQIKDLGLDLKGGDMAFCVFDTDYNKEETVNRVLTDSARRGIRVVLSKPCFEVFFLLHFTGNIDRLAYPSDAKSEIGTYLHGYVETGDYWKKLLPCQARAVERSRAFVLNGNIDLKRQVNGTNIYVFFDALSGLETEDQSESR